MITKQVKLFLFMLFVLPFAVISTFAGTAFCRSDPLIVLSDGTVIDLSVDIGAMPWQVQGVDYVLHGPEGTYVVAVVEVPTWITSRETFTYHADQPPGQFQAFTTVRTRTRDIDVTANAILISATGVRLDLASASGKDRQTIHTQFRSR